MKRILGFFCMLLLLLLVGAGFVPLAKADSTYPLRTYFIYEDGTFQTFNLPGRILSTFVGINNAGEIAGTLLLNGTAGFIYSAGTTTTFKVPGAEETFFAGINNSGQIAGFYTNGALATTT